MPQVTILLLSVTLLLSACGRSTPNTKASFNAVSTHQHAADWLPSGHKAAAKKSLSACSGCHGGDFRGGISRVSCGQCHLGGTTSKHPEDWSTETGAIWTKHAAYTATLRSAGCANGACHGTELEGVSGSGPSCTSCHLDGVGSKHPREWGEYAGALHADYTLANGAAKCANGACHGTSLGGVAGSGPACATCHAAPGHGVLNEYAAACTSCHTAALNIDTNRMMHPFDPGTAPTASTHAAYARTAGTASCAVAACHGTELKGGADANCPSCESCHLGGVTSMHPASWGAAIIQEHQNYVRANSTAGCANAACHGPNLTGGASSAPACTSCHVGGVTTISKHPFADPAVVNHKAYVSANGTSSCALSACHGPDLAGSGNAPSCVTACHSGSATAKHPASFGPTADEIALNHKAYIALNAVNGKDGMDSCRNAYCHGSSLNGAAPALGPSCMTTQCHQIGSPVVLTNCASCHGKPPTGTLYPNFRGAHAAHNALPGVANVCDTCHSGAGTGSATHFNGAVETRILSVYNAKSGDARGNANGSCSNVSCHGGKTTPSYLTGAIDVNKECALCHEYGTAAGVPEANSFWSGRHDFHVNTAHFACKGCHDVGKLAVNHFTTLNTFELEGPASATILDSLNYSGGSCNVVCHPGARTWQP